MSNFIIIPYENDMPLIINIDELRKIELRYYRSKNNKAEILYYLTDKIITQKFDFEYDPYIEHEKEWDNICPCHSCKDEDKCGDIEWKPCEMCSKIMCEFEVKYKCEISGYNVRAADNVIKRIEKNLNVIDLTSQYIEGETKVKDR